MAIKDRIKKLRQEKQMTLEEVSKIVGVSRQTIQKYENGIISNIPSDKIELLAKALDTTPAYIMGWEEEKQESRASLFDDPRILPIEKKKIPLLGGIACGKPIFKEEFESYVEVATNVKADFALKAVGNSMVNIGIKDGYIVFIRQQPAVDNGEVAAVNIDGEFTLKRVYNYGDILVLRSENPDFPDMELREGDADNIVILGKAVAFQGNVR